jgi:prophage antirepressor-like protein
MKVVNMTVYDFNEDAIRVVEDGGQVWFVFRDAALALGYGNPDQVRLRIPEVNLRQMEVENTRGQIRETWCVNLEGLNYLIFGSTRPEAEEFKKLAAAIMAEFQTTGQVKPKKVLPDRSIPAAHLIEPVQRTTSAAVNGIAFAMNGVDGIIGLNVAVSNAYFGKRPKQMVRELEQEFGLRHSKTRSLPKTLTMTVPEVAAGYSFTKRILETGQSATLEQAVDIGKTVEELAGKMLEAGLDVSHMIR